MRPPRGNVTFLFTDIERSSQLWEMHPQTMGRALAQHDDLVRTAVLEHNGYIFKTAGDAFCVAFGSAMNAVRAAADAQHALASAAWEDTGPLRVRMALHSGEAEHRDGDYFGQTLNRVARVLSAGHGGQTLLSRVTAERVREKLPRGISLRDLGERRLKDLSKPERIFQLVAPDLPAEFPPLRSLEVLPNNLPAQVTSFVGRTREMADVKRLLGNTRLLTLTGAGGTGKTRLSLQVAAEVLERFPHGVWLVELATASDPAIVPEAIASALDVRIERDRAPLDTLIDALEARNLLVVLDNCEHLIQACAQTASALLRRCPEIRILASSREALNIDGEVILPVPPLITAEFGRVGNDLQIDQLAELEAVQLFVERANAVKPGFSLTEENAKLLAEICWRLDGIPLAIELAAARVKVLSLEQILTRLDDRFRLLSGGSRTALPRQQTLGALIDWSYDLLSEPERMLLRRLTVFVAGRTLEMAEEVCAGDGLEKADVFDFLSALVEKSLLMVETGADGESRYTMLESVWDYGDTKLEQSGETARYRRRHLDYFVRFAEAAEPHLFGPEQKTWLERLHVEHYNLNFACAPRWEIPIPPRTGFDSRVPLGGIGRCGAISLRVSNSSSCCLRARTDRSPLPSAPGPSSLRGGFPGHRTATSMRSGIFGQRARSMRRSGTSNRSALWRRSSASPSGMRETTPALANTLKGQRRSANR
jgi:predicted ATPase/class 3 adenylate cyclase